MDEAKRHTALIIEPEPDLLTLCENTPSLFLAPTQLTPAQSLSKPKRQLLCSLSRQKSPQEPQANNCYSLTWLSESELIYHYDQLLYLVQAKPVAPTPLSRFRARKPQQSHDELSLPLERIEELRRQAKLTLPFKARLFKCSDNSNYSLLVLKALRLSLQGLQIDYIRHQLAHYDKEHSQANVHNGNDANNHDETNNR